MLVDDVWTGRIGSAAGSGHSPRRHCAGGSVPRAFHALAYTGAALASRWLEPELDSPLGWIYFVATQLLCLGLVYAFAKIDSGARAPSYGGCAG